MMEKLLPKPNPVHTKKSDYAPMPGAKSLAPKPAYTEQEIESILLRKSPGPLTANIGRFSTDPQGIRIDLLDANGKLSAHFHPLPKREGRPSTPIDMENWEPDAEFFVHAEPIIRQLLNQLKEKP